MKICIQCHQPKELTEFNKNRSRKDGLQGRCKACDRARAISNYYSKYRDIHCAYNIKRRKAIRNWLVEYRKQNACAKCGDKRWYVLDFHHPDDNKERTVSKLAADGYSLQRVKAEIRKCQIVCSNCHREIHYLLRLGASAVIAPD